MKFNKKVNLNSTSFGLVIILLIDINSGTELAHTLVFSTHQIITVITNVINITNIISGISRYPETWFHISFQVSGECYFIRRSPASKRVVFPIFVSSYFILFSEPE